MQIVYKTKEEWLKGRTKGIGGSDASAVVGYNPYKSNIDLFDEKTGAKTPIDISDKPYVQYGHDAEPLLVKLFALDYPQYEVLYNDDYRVNYHDKYPFIYCTRDCDLIEKSTGRKGALEIKTTEVLSSMHKEKWNNRVPDNYYCQILQYFITDSKIEFVWLKVQIKSVFNEDTRLTIKHYLFDRKDFKEDIEWLLENEINFWNNNILQKKRPSRILPNI